MQFNWTALAQHRETPEFIPSSAKEEGKGGAGVDCRGGGGGGGGSLSCREDRWEDPAENESCPGLEREDWPAQKSICAASL